MQRKIKHYINIWRNRGYPEDIPDEVPNVLMNLNLAPSYKAIALAILKNDFSLKSLGFVSEKTEWYNILKKIELKERGKKNGKSV